MGVTTLLGWMAREDPLATVALAVAIPSGTCGLEFYGPGGGC